MLEDRACIHLEAGPESPSINYIVFDVKGHFISIPALIYTENWEIFFSPFNAVYRLEAACWMCVCFDDNRLYFVSALLSQEATGFRKMHNVTRAIFRDFRRTASVLMA